jgi:hypothetical protein
MQNEELKPEMKVLVDYGGSLKSAKVIGPVKYKNVSTGELIEIVGWKVAIEPSGLGVTVTVDQISPRTSSSPEKRKRKTKRKKPRGKTRK